MRAVHHRAVSNVRRAGPQARIPVVVFGCSISGLASVADGSLALSWLEVFAHGDREFEVRGPVLHDEALAVHRAFWPRRHDGAS